MLKIFVFYMLASVGLGLALGWLIGWWRDRAKRLALQDVLIESGTRAVMYPESMPPTLDDETPTVPMGGDRRALPRLDQERRIPRRRHNGWISLILLLLLTVPLVAVLLGVLLAYTALAGFLRGARWHLVHCGPAIGS